jgi:hypothetical protein
VAFALSWWGEAAQAQDPVGTVTHLGGLSTALRADGTARLLGLRSVVHEGEILATPAGTYMEVRFLDDATLTLGPDSRVQLTRYSWNPDNPAADRVVIELQSGRLRSETGRLGKRNHDAIRIKVPGGEIAVRGTNFVVQMAPGVPNLSTPTPPSASPALPPGLYVQVIDGLINVSNKGGTTSFAAGQFGYTPNFSQPPVLVPANPGVQFTPPPAFNASTSPAGSTTPGKSNAVDCEVR